MVCCQRDRTVLDDNDKPVECCYESYIADQYEKRCIEHNECKVGEEVEAYCNGSWQKGYVSYLIPWGKMTIKDANGDNICDSLRFDQVRKPKTCSMCEQGQYISCQWRDPRNAEKYTAEGPSISDRLWSGMWS